MLTYHLAIAANDLTISPKSYDCLKGILEHFDPASFYTTSCFENGYATRRVLDFDLSDKANADRAEILSRIDAGEDAETVIASYLTDEAFDTWYDTLCAKLESKANP